MTIIYRRARIITAEYEFAFDTANIGVGNQFNAEVIPQGAVFCFGQVAIETQFNATGTDLLNIGVSAGGGHFMTNGNLDQVAGTIIPILGYSQSPLSADRNLFARYIGAATPATQGRAHIFMQFVHR